MGILNCVASFDVGKYNFAWYVEMTYDNGSIFVVNVCLLSVINRKQLFQKLNEKKCIWDICSHFIIENQRLYKHINNINMIQIAESTLSWFIIHYPDKIVRYINPSMKIKFYTKEKMNYRSRKKYTTNIAYNYFREKNILNMIKLYENKTLKLDDISDACVQCIVYKNIYLYNNVSGRICRKHD